MENTTYDNNIRFDILTAGLIKIPVKVNQSAGCLSRQFVSHTWWLRPTFLDLTFTPKQPGSLCIITNLSSIHPAPTNPHNLHPSHLFISCTMRLEPQAHCSHYFHWLAIPIPNPNHLLHNTLYANAFYCSWTT